MAAGTRARSYEEMVDALAEEGLPALQDKLSNLKPGDCDRPSRGSRRGPSWNSPPTSTSSWD
jgi:hypothetical protein